MNGGFGSVMPIQIVQAILMAHAVSSKMKRTGYSR